MLGFNNFLLFESLYSEYYNPEKIIDKLKKSDGVKPRFFNKATARASPSANIITQEVVGALVIVHASINSGKIKRIVEDLSKIDPLPAVKLTKGILCRVA